MTDLEKAIEGLYETFAVYPYDPEMDACPCCVAEKEKHDINKPLKTLQSDDVDRYAFKAMTTWGTTEDFKHFLPRILELLSRGELLTDIFVVLGKLTYGEWKKWTKAEQQAINDFLFAWWEVAQENAYLAKETFLEIHKLTGNIDPLLKSWKNGPHHLRTFVDFTLYGLADIAKGKGDFKHFSEDESRKLLDLIYSRKQEMESAFFHFELIDPAFAERISQAVFTLDRIGG